MRVPATFIGLVALLSAAAAPIVAGHGQMRNETFRLELQNATPKQPTPTPTPEVPVDTILYGEERAVFEREGYVVRSSFPFEETQASLVFGINDTQVEFREARVNTPAEERVQLTLSASAPFAFQTMISQENDFHNADGKSIPRTSCNSSAPPCTTTYARVWNANGSYGFGYSMQGSYIPADFKIPGAHRPMPIKNKKEHAVPVLFTAYAPKEVSAAIIFRLNLSPDYQENTYSNIVTLLTIPRL